mgnify:CR=1 FL=1
MQRRLNLLIEAAEVGGSELHVPTRVGLSEAAQSFPGSVETPLPLEIVNNGARPVRQASRFDPQDRALP